MGWTCKHFIEFLSFYLDTYTHMLIIHMFPMHLLLQICLSFYEVKNKKASWLSNKVERLYWEHWYINLNVAQNPKVHSSKSHHSKVVVDLGETALDGRSARKTALEAALQDVLFQIIKFVNEKKDHIPPIPTCEGISFPYEITIPSSSDSAFGMDMIKRMLQTGHPSMLG